MVLFKIDGGKRVPEIEMSLLDTILDLKQKIQELDVEVYRQRLWHKDRMLRDNELIHDQAFCASKTLHLTVTPLSPQHTLSVKVKFVGSDGYVEVKETDKDHLPLSAYYVNEATEVQLSVLIEPR
ncbi:hypothetical protein GYH30_036194 [Glycine max]|uniref:Ubiquitin-like domain-containing protein n=1 Tax=Glycine max TaxID=3847 RepID=K7LZR3_SOYBN|nr:hypothetical protein GYH30_036194 [Glycine max]